jgi:ATP-dependent protease ClpP protease subunit
MKKIKPERRLNLIDEVTLEKVKSLEDEIVKLMKKGPKDWISLSISSEGGQTGAGLAFFDSMRCLKPKLLTVALGDVQSMALIIFLAGEYRVVGRHSVFFIHEPARQFEANVRLSYSELKKILEFLQSDIKNITDIVAGRSQGKLTTKDVELMLKTDTLLPAEEAVEMGLAHEII